MDNRDYEDYLESGTWKDKKTSKIENVGSCCQKCGSEIQRSSLHLHHKHYEKEFGEETDEDLMLVCEKCHHELHQDLEFFDNEEIKKLCPECHKALINNKCLQCGIEIEFKNKENK